MRNLFYLIKSLARRGPIFLYIYFRESVLFDLRNGTNTHLRVPKPDEAEGSNERQDGLLYVASFTTVVRKSLQIAQTQLGPQFERAQFLDLGCGKGKAVLVYAQEFSTESGQVAVGIEYDQSLCEIGWKNIECVNTSKGKSEIYCDSALNLEQHVSDGPLVVYLYNSFQGETLRAVLRILEKYEHVLIYVDPAERDMLIEHGYTFAKESIGRYHASTWLVAVPTAKGAQDGELRR